ncbi:hypothetical protein PC113_g16268 [Phytophthora cactorum]|uniref:Uncharacterized protein n=1 Tax=Phytophthora cactorum TaxID=29920 RepID=A0A8T1BKP9_9STRA|nr:hypothetical protein PC113_g16268 [Phytophthora cactorum]KAG2902309.1 hypothetical protein PC115_g15650 [Phytophthora cactorum]KAG3052702.1 hypothetical protein PC121_g17158 [Phytophthora cactorum]KAG3146049.1 hypothetical protein C6341_g18157 [Phytophthora cactorum]
MGANSNVQRNRVIQADRPKLCAFVRSRLSVAEAKSKFHTADTFKKVVMAYFTIYELIIKSWRLQINIGSVLSSIWSSLAASPMSLIMAGLLSRIS